MGQQKGRNSQRQESRQELEKRTFFPDHWPFFERLFCDEEGRLYVQRLKSNLSLETENEADVFNADGFYIYRASVPENTLNEMGIPIRPAIQSGSGVRSAHPV